MWTNQYAVKVDMKWKQSMFYLEYGINAKPCTKFLSRTKADVEYFCSDRAFQKYHLPDTEG